MENNKSNNASKNFRDGQRLHRQKNSWSGSCEKYPDRTVYYRTKWQTH